MSANPFIRAFHLPEADSIRATVRRNGAFHVNLHNRRRAVRGAGGVLNILLDALFIILLKWGLIGAAVATVINQTLCVTFGVSPAVSYQFGAKGYAELRNLLRKSLTLVGTAGVVMFISAEILAPTWLVRLGIFHGAEQRLAVGGHFNQEPRKISLCIKISVGDKRMKTIFEPVKFKNLEMRNRLIRSATWEDIANANGVIAGEAYRLYKELATGGVGAIITGFTSVSANDNYFGGMMRLSSDKLIPYYRRLTGTVHTVNCPILAQLALGAYYKKNVEGETIEALEDELTTDEIARIVKLFIEAAQRAKAANFDGVQILAAHFFFLSRFISPYHNHRTDIYGGSIKNRTRILTEIISGIQHELPDFHVSVKINSNDFTNGGIDERESLEICRILADAGVDSIEVSGNGTSKRGVRAYFNEGYFSVFGIQLAEKVDVPVIVVGGWRSRDAMVKILRDTKIAALSMSRPLIREPELPLKFQLGESLVSQCVSCNACYSSPSHRCVFRKQQPLLRIEPKNR